MARNQHTKDERRVLAVESYDGYFLLADEFGLAQSATDEVMEAKITEVAQWASGLREDLRVRVIAALLRTAGNAWPSR